MQGGNWLWYGQVHLASSGVLVQALAAAGGCCPRWHLSSGLKYHLLEGLIMSARERPFKSIMCDAGVIDEWTFPMVSGF
jgi:hypothetical protein